MSRIHLDIPLNRAEGDLDIHVSFENNTIVEAQCIGTLYRGFENMLVDRVPMDALVITPRICGICSITHLTAAVKAIESANQIIPPPQAVRMRNLSIMAETVQSDIRQVFLMFLPDFAHEFYRDHDFYSLAMQQYAPLQGKAGIRALKASKDILKVIAIIGGQWPHTSHMVPGGICTIPTLVDMTMVSNHIENMISWYENEVLGCSLAHFNENITSCEQFNRYIEQYKHSHLAAFTRLCQQAGLQEIGQSYPRFISYGSIEHPEKPAETLIRSGIYNEEQYFELNTALISEDISHSWYQAEQLVQHPFHGTTRPDRANNKAYTWSKAPRYADASMQTGPLAQALVDNDPLLHDWFRHQRDSVFVRQLARLIRPAKYLQAMREQIHQVLRNFGEETYLIPGDLVCGKGAGLTEAARGALGHWLEIENSKIKSYQIITPTAWNASPRDKNQQPGPWEKALTGLRIQDIDNPMEMGHVIRSFDPCLVCTVHHVGENSKNTQWRYML